DPVVGRFLSADPVLDLGLGAQSANRYAYVGNSPLSFTDPTGLSSRATRLPKHDAGTHGPLLEPGTFVMEFGGEPWTVTAGLDEVVVTAGRSGLAGWLMSGGLGPSYAG